MSGGLDTAQLGVAGIVVVLCVTAVAVLWKEVIRLNRQAREDLLVTLPALAEATRAVQVAADLARDVIRGQHNRGSGT